MTGEPGPKFVEAQVEIFTKDEVKALLKACDFCLEAQTDQCR
jgi:hypothetical protein